MEDRRVELLAPAGDFEKFKMAINYGADAVYLGGEAFGLRKRAKNFSIEDIEKAVEYAHNRDKKVYVTLNIVPHNEDLIGLEEYVTDLYRINVDGVIVSDPGIYSIIRRTVPKLAIHISTQASVTNYETIMFWYELGVRRIVLARELSLEEIKEIRARVPKDLEIECFVHGAMCIAYSGRCLLSSYMTGRDANRGDCAHPCRYRYNLVEQRREGEYFPVYEEDGGTFIFNSKDLCMIEHIPELIEAGINSFKIEGRVKSVYYVATVIRAYRKAIDEYYKDPLAYKYQDKWLDEVKKVSHRKFTTGFYFNKPDKEGQVYSTSSYLRKYDFIGMVLDYDKDSRIATIEQRNKFSVGEEIEIFGPNTEFFTQKIDTIWNDQGDKIKEAPHPQQVIRLVVEKPVEKFYLLRRKREER